jgi:hypothetical protein
LMIDICLYHIVYRDQVLLMLLYDDVFLLHDNDDDLEELLSIVHLDHDDLQHDK